MTERNKIHTHFIPSLQGSLVNRTRLTLRPKYTKEPFSPSHANPIEPCYNMIDNALTNEDQLVTLVIKHSKFWLY